MSFNRVEINQKKILNDIRFILRKMDRKIQKVRNFKWSSRLEVNIWEWVLSKGGSLVGSVVVAHVDDVVQGSPSDNCSLLVPVPLGGYSWEVGVIHVWDSGGNFCSWNHSVEVWHLLSVSWRLLNWVVSLQKVVPVGVSGSEDFNWVDLIYINKLLDEHSMRAYFES